MKFQDYKYTRPDLEKVKTEFKALIQQFEDAQDVETQIQLIDQMNEIRKAVDSESALVYVRASIDTTDEFYSKERDFFDENGAEIVWLESAYYNAITKSQFKSELIEKYGEQLFALAELYVKQYDDSVKDLINEENKIVSEYSKLVASAEIEFDGKTLNLAQLAAYMQNPDREVRKAALIATQDFRGKHLEDFDDIYDRLVKVRHQIATTLGFKNFIELGYVRMRRVDYDQAMVKNYREQIATHVVPLATKLYQAQAKRIGVDTLKFYDEDFKFNNGNAMPKDDAKMILENGRKMYHELSKETAEFYDFMMERELFDVEAKKGKEAGGYCTFINNYNSPFIFSNFNGTDGDITVLTHEAGHAFQVYSSQHLEVPDYLWPTHESCEIHSMSMEFFTYPWMKLFFENPEKFIYKHIGDAIQFLPYGVAVDEFQHIVYENPTLTKEERRAEWKKLEAKYLPNRDYDGIAPLVDGSFWHKQGHIFASPFYYIDYTLAQVCAFQFFKRSTEDFDSAWKDYLHLCKIGGSLPFNALVKEGNLVSPFESGTLSTIMTFLDQYIENIDTSSF
ncbi:M3 family oligoendopeptidase [Macrococcus sp. DPC7161]|uniref:M3 family oligoendopeptidase n=1 Tax=Macrococcus sp. DPC7161 TaxID=2507060 RepID=UPI00100B7E5F|nr:M3 family oligoendopeptidase [Macrococcus sp. DPC7161]RXK17851.1 M3 family oligoendopeptidase [Macrococcus sp. DPC7161]